MSKKTRLMIVLALALSALFLLPTVVSAAPRTEQHSGKTTTASFAFTGSITEGAGKGTALTGGLTLQIRSSGFFTGTFKLPGNTQLPVIGNIFKDGSLKIIFYNTKDGSFILGQGKPDKAGTYVGPFQVFSNGKQVAAGKWSAVAVADPAKSLALAFTGSVVSGTNKGLQLAGALVLNSHTLKGQLSLADGTLVPVSATLSKDGKKIKVTFDLGNGVKILGTGTLVTHPLKGFQGPFSGPAANDKGTWTAYFFKF